MILNVIGGKEDVYDLMPEKGTLLTKSIGQMERGEFASDEEVEAVWAKYSV